MSILKNKPILIGLILVLVTIKFAILPIVNWQENKVLEIQKKNKQLKKGLALVDNQQDLAFELLTLQQFSLKQLQLVAGTENTAIQYQLNIQRKIEALIEKYELRSRSVSWLNKVDRDGHEEHRLEVSLAGTFKGFISLLTEIEKQKPKLALLEFRSNISKMFPNRNELGQFSGKFVVISWRAIPREQNE